MINDKTKFTRRDMLRVGTAGSIVLLGLSKPDKPAVAAEAAGPRFPHQANAANIDGNSTRIDHFDANDNPNALIFVTPVVVGFGPEGVRNSHFLGVRYEGNRWYIYNQDEAPMPAGALFSVHVHPRPESGEFLPATFLLHRAAGANISDNRTILDHWHLNGRSDLSPQLTSNRSPGGEEGIDSNLPVGFDYDQQLGRWLIVNMDGTPMRSGAAFNVAVPSSGNRSHVSSTDNIMGDRTGPLKIDYNGWLEELMVTPSFGGAPEQFRSYNPHPVGVLWDGTRGEWFIVNLDRSPMPKGVIYLIWRYP
jgi:hypothetical protein